MQQNNKIIDWLLEDNNPAVKYRTQTELLGVATDKTPVTEKVNSFIPQNWEETKGLWYIYYLTSIAECGLSYKDIKFDADKALSFNTFENSCADFMRLRTLVMLGLGSEPQTDKILDKIKERQLPDGGFLCLHRLDKLGYIPKSCVKSNLHALMLCAELKKRGIEVAFESGLLSYFWNHDLFYRTSDRSALILNAREGWRTIDTFHPFELMRIGLHNFTEAFCALGYGNDERLNKAWNILNSRKNNDGAYLLDGTLVKSYLPKEHVGKPSKWVTFYSLLAEKEKTNNNMILK